MVLLEVRPQRLDPSVACTAMGATLGAAGARLDRLALQGRRLMGDNRIGMGERSMKISAISNFILLGLLSLILLGAGVYGYAFDLRLWGMPMVFSMIMGVWATYCWD